MYVAPADASLGEHEWRPFVVAQGFGHLVAAGRGREVPVVVPTQFLLDNDEVLLHLVTANPLLEAIAECPRVLLSVAGDWAYVPSDWKAIGDEDPMLAIPTTYYGAVQLVGDATVEDDPEAIARILRLQLADLQPATPIAEPTEAHAKRLRTICGIRIAVHSVQAKFKYGGNVDRDHRRAVVEQLLQRGAPGDAAAARHVVARLGD